MLTKEKSQGKTIYKRDYMTLSKSKRCKNAADPLILGYYKDLLQGFH